MLRLTYRLAESKGVTVEQLGGMMGADEFIYWAAYDQLSPIGPERFDHLNAMLMTLINNLWSKKRYRPRDFSPQWGAAPKSGCNKAKIMAYFIGIKARQDALEAKHNVRTSNR